MFRLPGGMAGTLVEYSATRAYQGLERAMTDLFDILGSFVQGENARLFGAFFGVGMFILTMVRFLRNTGTKLGVTLARHVDKGVSWSPYAAVGDRRGLRLGISNTGQEPVMVADAWLEIKGAKDKMRPEPYRGAMGLRLPVGEGRSFFAGFGDIPGLKGDALVRAVVRESGKGIHKGAWVAVRVPMESAD